MGLSLYLPGFHFKSYNLVNKNMDNIAKGFKECKKEKEAFKKRFEKPGGKPGENVIFASYPFSGYRKLTD